MKLIDFINKISIKEIFGNKDISFNEISKDTRTINKDDLYMGIKGETFDGNSFYMKAYENGASVCLLDNINVDDELKSYLENNNKCLIVVDNTLAALEEYCLNLRNELNIPVISVTGSAGKTSTKDIIASVVSTKYKTLKNYQNYNNNIGVPLTMSRYSDEEVMILEMGAQYVGEIDSYCKYARPNIGVITNIGTAHIGEEFFNGRENILKGKTEVVNYMDEDGILIINNDNDMLHKYYLENKDKRKFITVGIDEESDVMASDIVINENNSSFMVDGKKIVVPISGIHFIYNVLEAIAVAKLLNISLDDVQKGLDNLEMSNNRMNVIKKENITIINDAYNANAEAMKYAIRYLGKQSGRKIAIVGSMLELGKYTKELHEKVAQELIDNNIDAIISIGKEMEFLHNYLENKNISNIYHLDNKDGLIELFNKIKQDNDVVLLKGSNGLRLFDLIDEL